MSLLALKWVFDHLDCPELKPTERCVLQYLCYRSNDKTGECFPSMLTIATHSGVSERRARDAVRDLEARGLIKSIRRVGQAGNSSNQYDIAVFNRTLHTGTKKAGETGTPLPGTDRQTVAGDKGLHKEKRRSDFLAKGKGQGEGA